GEEGQAPPVVRLVHLPLLVAVDADAARLAAVRVHLPDLPVPAALGGEEHLLPVVREARQAVLRRIVGETALVPALRRRQVDVLVPAHHPLVDEGRGQVAGGPGGGRRGRRGASACAGQQTQAGGEETARHSSAGASAASVPLALAMSVALMNSSRSPSNTRSTSPTSCLVRWSFTMR